MNGLEIYSFTYSIGPALLQVVAFKRRNRSKGSASEKLVQDLNLSAISPQFWPYQERKEVILPPLKYIEGDDIQVFANRWKTLYPAPVRR